MENSRKDELKTERCLVSRRIRLELVNLINLLVKVITFNK